MKKVNFKKLEVQVSFDGTKMQFDIAKILGNDMMYNGSVICDIGFEELAKKIYYSTGEVEIPDQYIPYIKQVMKERCYIASVRRTITGLLDGQ